MTEEYLCESVLKKQDFPCSSWEIGAHLRWRAFPRGQAQMDQEINGLLSNVEDAFGFVIPNESAEHLFTAGQLYDYILAHRYAGKRDECLTAIVAYKLRRGMMWALKIERDDIRLSKTVASLIPSHRYRAWRALQRATSLRLPLLRRPSWVMTAAVAGTFAAAIVTPWAMGFGFLNGAILIGLMTAFIVGHASSWLTIPLATRLPSDCATFQQLAAATVARNYQAVVEEACKPTGNGDVWSLLRAVLAEHWGVRPETIDRETELRRNLVAA